MTYAQSLALLNQSDRLTDLAQTVRGTRQATLRRKATMIRKQANPRTRSLYVLSSGKFGNGIVVISEYDDIATVVMSRGWQTHVYANVTGASIDRLHRIGQAEHDVRWGTK